MWPTCNFRYRGGLGLGRRFGDGRHCWLRPYYWLWQSLYLSVDQETREQQLRRHKRSREQEAVRRREGMPSDSETIAILAELVRRPHTTARHIAALLSARELPITRQQVLAVIDKYDLRKKRASRRSRS